MAKIDIDIETIRSSSTTLEAKVNELKVLRFDLYKLISQIDDTWDGPASRSYINRLNDYLKKIDVMLTVLPYYAEYLKNTANDMERLDSIWKTIIKFFPNSYFSGNDNDGTLLKM